MNLLDAIAKHQNGIIGTLAIHMLLFVWFNLENMSFTVIDPKEKVVAIIDFTDEFENKENENEILENNNSEEISNVASNINQEENTYSSQNTSLFDQQKANEEVLNELKAFEAKEFQTLEADNPDLIKDDSKQSINPNLIKDDAEENDLASYGSTINASAKYSLIDRNALYQKIPSYKCKNEGIVRILIKVNQKGKVVSQEIDEKHTTTSNSCLIEHARKYASYWRFNQNYNDVVRKQGWIEFTYLSQ